MIKKLEYKFFIFMLFALLCGLFIVSFFVGRYSSITVEEIIKIIINQIYPVFNKTWTDFSENVVIHLRLPRILSAAVVGAALSASGTAYQALFSNPMASPDTLGVSSGAGLGAAIAILFGLGSFWTQFSAFALGCISVAVSFVLAMTISRGKNSTVFLVLTGMVISSFLSSVLSIIKYIADPLEQLPEIVYWLMGSLSAVNLTDVKVVLIFFICGFIPLYLLRWRMNLLTLSEAEAISLGENINILKMISVICSTLLTASAISISGGIGWVGLIVPHISRIIVGDDFRRLLPVSALLGSIYLLLMDNIARSMMTSEIPIGILTSLLGTPLFFGILIKNRKSVLSES